MRPGTGMTTTVGKSSTGLILTCKGLPSGRHEILVSLQSPKIVKVHLKMKLTLLSGVFVCDCEIDTSNWCIQTMSSSLSHSQSPGIKMSVPNSRLICL